MKKLSIILIVALLVLSTVGLVACGGDGNKTVTTTVTFKNGAETIGTANCDGVTLVMPVNPTKDGFTFSGWFIDEAMTAEFNKATYIASSTRCNITLYAVYVVNIYTITFGEKGGSAVTDITADYNASVTLPTTAKEGYTFKGWSTTEDGSNLVKYTTMPAEDITLYAVYVVNIYTITFDEKGGSEVADITDDYNAYVALSEPTLVGHNFVGWSTTEDGSDIVTPTTMPAGNIILYAVWQRFTEGLSYIEDGNGGYMVSKGTVKGGDVVLPSFHEAKPVTSIAVDGFRYNAITSIIFGKNIISVGESAFLQCTALTSITLTDSVTTIGNYAFMNCSSLASITIPDSVTTIGNYAFSECYSLTSVTIPNGVTTIGQYAFHSCLALTSVTIPNGVTTIGDNAFYECYSLASITISDSVTTIGEYAFYECYALTSITIPDSVTTIGEGAFSGCKSLTSITIPNGVTTIGKRTFEKCDSLTSITIPDSVTTIGNGAFLSCKALASITIPDSVTTIGNGAFQSCTALTSITIPNSVTTMGKYVFFFCSAKLIINVEILEASKPIGWDASWQGGSYKVNWGVKA